MNSSTFTVKGAFRESLKTLNSLEGWDYVEPRQMTNPYKPAGVKESFIGRHVELYSLRDLDPETSASLSCPCPSPPSPGTETFQMTSLENCSSPCAQGDSLPSLNTASSDPEEVENNKKKIRKNFPSIIKSMIEIIKKLFSIRVPFLKNINCKPNVKKFEQPASCLCPPGDALTSANTPPPDQRRETNEYWHFFTLENIIIIHKVFKDRNLNFILDILPQRKIEISKRLNDVKISEIDIKISHVKEICFYKLQNYKTNCQHAVAIFHKKDGSEPKLIGPFYPAEKHSEDFIIEEIEYLIQTKEINDFSEIWIYTVNNPCIGRKNQTPCMYNLINLSIRLSQDYGIKMYISFTKFYVFIRNMADLIGNSKELEDSWKRIIEYYNLNLHSKFSVKFDNLNIPKKQFPKNKRQLICDNITNILSECPDSVQTYEEWKQTGIETAERLVLRVRETTGDSADDFFEVKSVFIELWYGKLNEKLTEIISKQMVLFYLTHIQGREHYPVFFKFDPYE
ncbi:uncharacterized protein LOC117598580 [Pangasianodon hypophthalmus]|uniref:uncharacterized protein LOC117598580 n=1 Tax=Pangasianodon hypophthalmus TaxID=310915 RepID=UPI00147D3DFD|nr:uncharacterized protein LOC117598580 [Pangasianodon hypophthalmus]